MSQCSICCDNYTKTTRKQIKCPFCVFECCLACFRKYLLSLHQDPFCMGCKHGWTFEFISQQTPTSFHNDEYRNHRVNQLVDQQKSMLPATQPLVERANRSVKITNASNIIRKQLLKLQQKKHELQTLLYQVGRSLDFNRDVIINPDGTVSVILINPNINPNIQEGKVAEVEEKVERRQFMRACPADECRGFLSSAWKCGICEIWVCPDCHIIKKGKVDDEHKCDPGMVETAKLLAKDTKPCPKCAASIFKIDGCDQMWCTQCNTAFSWKSGLIVTSVIHNPHYYQWLRQQNGGVAPRNAGDVVCGGVVDYYVLNSTLVRFKIKKEHIDMFMNIHRGIHHIRYANLNNYNDRMERDFSELRVKYLQKLITLPKWTIELKRLQKKYEKIRAAQQIHQMYVTIATTFIDNVVQLNPANEEFHNQFEEIVTQLHKLRDYTNTNLQIVAYRFKNKVDEISNKWTTP
jgi:hypothetical protein